MKLRVGALFVLVITVAMRCHVAAQLYGTGALIVPENGALANFKVGAPIAAYYSFIRPLTPSSGIFGQWPDMVMRSGRVFTSPDAQIALVTDVNGYVQEVVSVSPETFTQRFIRPGASVAAVLQAYGQATRVVPTSCGSALVYAPGGVLPSFSAGLAFRVCGNLNTVVAISVFNPNPGASW